MADASQGWWKLTFLRKKKKVVYEIPADYTSNTTSTPSGAAHPEESVHDPQLDARLERIVEKETAREGRHVKVSHSGRFKEKKKVRSTLAENPDMFQGTGKVDSPSGDKRNRSLSWKINDSCIINNTSSVLDECTGSQHFWNCEAAASQD